MKNVILTLVSVFIINTIHAQHNDLAYLNTNTFKYYSSPTHLKKETKFSGAYYKAVVNTNSSEIVSKLERQILEYNLKNKSIYDNSEAASYLVRFKSTNAKALVNYNNNGEILSSKEVYKNIKIPDQIRNSIAQSFPNWSTEKSVFKINYTNNKTLKKLYIIVIKKGQSTKTLKYNGITFKQMG
ncbi:hypothetical protein VOI54_12150 [Tamlana sp. 2201CG12-4]|uniref:hypothetical protein n=1 Tax=Tamlana sp. 2201CG12-4 TaxID=3112582 RepID=UPI002DB7AD79|nr:hypothetical protein [Tamlana sp. 2201CG12-4]MEC3907775.1 hypothetical protein [Tamlana sp. 2201CG12-4]